MAVFQFKLEPLLKHRRTLEEQAQSELAQRLRHKLMLENQLRDQQQTIVTDKASMADSLVGRVDVGRIRQHAMHQHQVALRVQQIAMRLLELNREIDEARASLIEAAKQRKAVERLKEKQFERWRAAQEKARAAELDELATQAYARRPEEPLT